MASELNDNHTIIQQKRLHIPKVESLPYGRPILKTKQLRIINNNTKKRTEWEETHTHCHCHCHFRFVNNDIKHASQESGNCAIWHSHRTPEKYNVK